MRVVNFRYWLCYISEPELLRYPTDNLKNYNQPLESLHSVHWPFNLCYIFIDLRTPFEPYHSGRSREC